MAEENPGARTRRLAGTSAAELREALRKLAAKAGREDGEERPTPEQAPSPPTWERVRLRLIA